MIANLKPYPAYKDSGVYTLAEEGRSQTAPLRAWRCRKHRRAAFSVQLPFWA